MRKLLANEINVKVKQVFKTPKWSGFCALLYKDARCDMEILDEVYGPMNWQAEYKEVKGNLYCGIGVRNQETGDWVWKWDCGIESRVDDDGNQKKGEASDSFKRAGFKWGIGRELYTAPMIMIAADVEEVNGKKFLKDKYATYSVSKIDYDGGEIAMLEIVNQRGVPVYNFVKKGYNGGKQ